MTRLRLEDVGFVYPDGTRALAGVDLTVEPGETVAIIGQNGSGKSTLVRLLNGLLRPTEGRVLHDEVDVAGTRVAALAARVGIVFQNPDRPDLRGQGPRRGRVRAAHPGALRRRDRRRPSTRPWPRSA